MSSPSSSPVSAPAPAPVSAPVSASAPGSAPSESSDLEKKISRRLRWAIIVGVLIVFLLPAFFIVSWLILSPLPEPMVPPTPEDMVVQQRIFNKVYREVFSQRPPAEAELRLTPDEVNSMIRCIFFTGAAAGRYGFVERQASEILCCGNCVYRDGFFYAELPVVRDMLCGLFGGMVVVKIEGFPTKHDGKLDLSISSCHVGMIKLSASWVESIADARAGELMKREKMRVFNHAVKSMEKAENGDVIIVYRPPELLKLIRQMIGAERRRI